MFNQFLTVLVATLGLGSPLAAAGQAPISDQQSEGQQVAMTIINTTGLTVTMDSSDRCLRGDQVDRTFVSDLAEIAAHSKGTTKLPAGRTLIFSVPGEEQAIKVLYETTVGSKGEHARRIIFQEQNGKIVVEESLQGVQAVKAERLMAQ
jgi:hypothetical protein